MSRIQLHRVARAAGLSPGGGRGRPSGSWRARWTVGIAAAAAAAVSGAVLLAAPPALAASATGALVPLQMVFQANTGALWEACTAQSDAQCVSGQPLGLDPVDTGLGMAAGTSPSITYTLGPHDTGGYEAAFQANTGDLWTTGILGNDDLGLGIMPGTSPAIENNGGGFEIAYQDLHAELAVTELTYAGAVSTAYTGLPMAAGTSPAITAVPDGGYEVAYQNSSGSLAVDGTQSTGSLGLGMQAGTNPAITEVSGGYQIAFQANTGDLWTAGTLGTGNLDLGIMAGTSPTIAMTGDQIPNVLTSTYEIAFQANTGQLWVTGSLGTGNLDLDMAAGTSPAIRGTVGITTVVGSTPSTVISGYAIAYQSSGGALSFYDSASDQVFDTGLGMDNSTSPAMGGGYGS
jgi:hypothetical protein